MRSSGQRRRSSSETGHSNQTRRHRRRTHYRPRLNKTLSNKPNIFTYKKNTLQLSGLSQACRTGSILKIDHRNPHIDRAKKRNHMIY